MDIRGEKLQSQIHPVNKSVQVAWQCHGQSQLKDLCLSKSQGYDSKITDWKLISGGTKGKDKEIWLHETLLFDLISGIHTYQANARYARIVCDKGDL